MQIGAVLACLLAQPPATVAEESDDVYAVAANHYRKQRWTLAAVEFETFVDRFPNHRNAPPARFFLGEALIQLRDFAAAHRHFARFVQDHPGHDYRPTAMFRQGESSFLLGEHERARKELELFRSRWPTHEFNAFALPYLGEIALAREDFDNADKIFRQALRQHPNTPLGDACRLGLARSLENQGELDEAARFYAFLMRSQTGRLADDAALQFGVLHFHRQEFAAAAGAFEQFESTWAASPLRTQARYWHGRTLASQKKYVDALALLAKIQVDTNHRLAPAIRFAEADILRRAGRMTRAQQRFAEVFATWPQSEWADDSLQAEISIALNGRLYDSVIQMADEFERHYADSPLAAQVALAAGQAHLKLGRYADAERQFSRLVDDDTTLAASTRNNVYYYLAVVRLAESKHTAAIEALDKVELKNATADLVAAVQVTRSSALVGLERFSDAIDPLTAYLEANPTGADAARCRAQLVIAHTRQANWTAAGAAFAQYRQSNADDEHLPKTAHFLAESAFAAKQFELAETGFVCLADGTATEFVPVGLSGKAWTLVYRNELEPACNTFARLLERFPESPLAAEAAFVRAQALDELKRPDEALASYRLLVDQYQDSPHAATATFQAARLHARLKQTTEAAATFEQLAARHPDFAQLDTALYEWAWLLVKRDQAARAEGLFERLANDFPDSKYWADATWRLAERAVRSGDHDRAQRLAEKIVAAQRDATISAHALYLQGQLAAKAGRWNDVTRLMRNLVDADSTGELKSPALYWLAESLYRQDQTDDAATRFAQLADRKDVDESLAPAISLRRAQLLARQEKWREAYDVAVEIPTRFPAFRQAYEVDYLLGRCLSSQAKFSDAREAFERVVRSPAGGRSETAAMAQWMIGESYFLQENYGDAIRAYHRVESLFGYPKWQAAALLQAGKCYEVRGEWKSAVELYSQLLKDYPDNTFAEQAAVRLREAHVRMTNSAIR